MKLKVLVCEDEKYINDQISEMLNEEGVEVTQVFSRDEVLDILLHKFFNVAIIDLNLEGSPNPIWQETGGMQAIKLIKKQNFGTKCIVLSANPKTELSYTLGKDFGVEKYVTKGETIDELDIIIESTKNALNKSKVVYPTSVISFMSGENNNFDSRIWMDNTLTVLKPAEGSKGLMYLFNQMLLQYYPLVFHKKYGGLLLDKEKKMITGEFWSLMKDAPLHVCIKNDAEFDEDIEKHNEIRVYNTRAIFEKTKTDKSEFINNAN